MKQKAKIWAVVHFVILAVLIWWNYYSNTGNINENTVGSLSDKYDSLFTPAGYTFAIWGIIYLSLLYGSIYMLYHAFKKDKPADFVNQVAPWLSIAHVLNGVWLWFWLNEQIGLCAFLISAIFISLMIAVFKANMQKSNPSFGFITGVWWPIDFYVGWLAVAAIANISSFLNTTAWGQSQNEVMWTVILLITAVVVNLIMIFTRNMREFALVGVWALTGIAMRHWDKLPTLQYVAIGGACVLGLAILIHAYKNRKTLPFIGKDFNA